MIKVIKIIGIVGFVICLFIMYATSHGIQGIRKFDPSFRLLDMRFHYNVEAVHETFQSIGTGGRIAYCNYLILDFVFILCFLITMVTVTKGLFAYNNIVCKILYIVCALRAIFDILENILLLIMLNSYPSFGDSIAIICSCFTSLKFIMLYIWVFGVFLRLLVLR